MLLSFDDETLSDLFGIAAAIPYDRRDAFLRQLAAELGDTEVGVGSLYRAARRALRTVLRGMGR